MTCKNKHEYILLSICLLSGDVLASIADYTTGSGGLGNISAIMTALVMGLLFVAVVWVSLITVREYRDRGEAFHLVTSLLRCGIVLGIGGALITLLS